MKRKPIKHVTVTSSPKGKGRKKEFADDISFPRLAYRTCPLVLVDAMQNMTERQKNDVIAMGFGNVLTIKVKDIPTQLGYWVLDNFDPVSCEIKLQNDKLRITSEDVYRVLGLSKGTKPIRRKEKNEQVESYKKWISGFSESEYGVLKYGAKPSDVKKDMLKQNECGEVFRRHFMVLLNHCLIESCSSGYVKPQIMDCFEDVSSLEDWDWCDYVKSRLVKHRINWEKNKNNDFYGPILFLTALYLDRVEIFGLGVPRKFPTIRNWMPGDMKKRQKSEIAAGGFGAGYLYKTSEVPVIMDPPTPSKHTNESENRSSGDMDKYADCFISKAKNIASLMLELVCMIEKAPPNIAQSESFKVIINATQKLCAFNPNDCSTSNEPTQSQFTFFNSDCEFWREAYRITAMAEIENAVIRRNDFIRSSQPSFRLGILTQEFGVKGDQIQVAQTDNNTTPNTEKEHNNEEIARPPSLNDHCSEPDLHHEKEDLVMDEKIHKICMEIEKIGGAEIEDAVIRQNDFIESSQPSFSLGILTQEFGVKGDQIQVAHTDNNTTPNTENEHTNEGIAP